MSYGSVASFSTTGSGIHQRWAPTKSIAFLGHLAVDRTVSASTMIYAQSCATARAEREVHSSCRELNNPCGRPTPSRCYVAGTGILTLANSS